MKLKLNLKSKDPRVNVSHMSFNRYFIVLGAILLICALFVAIYFLAVEGTQENAYRNFIIFLILATYIATVSGILSVLFVIFWDKYFIAPVERLTTATRRVAHGDFNVRISPMRKDGKKDEFEVLFEDFNAMAAELGSIELLKQDFVSTVSHELKTPLAVIQSYTTMLQSESLTEEERREYTQKIADATKRLSELVTDTLQLNKLEHNNLPVQKTEYALGEQLCRCILDFDPILEEKQIDLETQFDPALTVISSEELLAIVWHNLLSNAIKFTPAGGKIRVAVQEEDGVSVTVEDSGCGMTEEQMRHAFDKFYQGDPSHSTKGNGLGLALVKRIVTLINGRIEVKSVPGEGSAFTVYLPKQ